MSAKAKAIAFIKSYLEEPYAQIKRRYQDLKSEAHLGVCSGYLIVTEPRPSRGLRSPIVGI